MQHVLLMCHWFVSIWFPSDRRERLIHLCVIMYVLVWFQAVRVRCVNRV